MDWAKHAHKLLGYSLAIAVLKHPWSSLPMSAVCGRATPGIAIRSSTAGTLLLAYNKDVGLMPPEPYMNIWTRNSGILSCSTGATPIVIAYISISIQMQLAFSWFQTRSGWRCWISPLSFRPKWDAVSSLLDCRALQSGHVGFSKKRGRLYTFQLRIYKILIQLIVKFWY